MNYSSLNHAIFALTALPDHAVILDIGCRDSSFLAGFVETFPGKIKKAIGVDQTDKGFGNYSYADPIELRVMDCGNGINFPDNTFDFVFSKDMFECVTDKKAFVHEIHRILKPGGCVLCVNCDWDSIVYNGADKTLITKAIHAYAETKQPWMDDLDSWIGRRMFGYFHVDGLFDDALSVHSVTETAYHEGMFGYDFSHHIGWLSEANTGALSKEEFDAFIENLNAASRDGSYLFVKPYYIYKGIKKLKD